LQLLQLPAVQVHVVPPLGMLPTVHVPASPELEPDPELEPLPEPELEPDDPDVEPLPEPELEPDDPELVPLPEPELEPDEPEVEPLPEPELDEPELEPLPEVEPELDLPPELEPLDPPELDAPPSFPNDPPPLSDEDEQEASTAMTAGRTRRTVALIGEPSCEGVGGSVSTPPVDRTRGDRVMGRAWQNLSRQGSFFLGQAQANGSYCASKCALNVAPSHCGVPV
jgi:hypothetical protein